MKCIHYMARQQSSNCMSENHFYQPMAIAIGSGFDTLKIPQVKTKTTDDNRV